MALLPPGYLKSVVSIEAPNSENELKPIGTGFIYADVIERLENGQFSVRDYLVTAKHVLYKERLPVTQQRHDVFLRFDKLGEDQPQIFQLPLYDENNQAVFSFPSGDIDVAVIRLPGANLDRLGIDYVRIIDSETALAPAQFVEAGLSVGDEVFFLGFPMGIRGEERNYAICRAGMIARVDRECLKKYTIYLDAPVFPGNSGGPVFCKPEMVHIDGTKAVQKAYLLGIATNYLCRDEEDQAAFTEQEFERMSGHLGLSKIVTVDAIDLAISEHERRFPPAESVPKKAVTPL